jgi:hypothetical protein
VDIGIWFMLGNPSERELNIQKTFRIRTDDLGAIACQFF